jgi:hypothetical protein
LKPKAEITPPVFKDVSTAGINDKMVKFRQLEGAYFAPNKKSTKSLFYPHH